MNPSFDPYHKWLRIPPEEQPPSHYRLLCFRPFENDLDVIENAAERQMAHLRSALTGERAALASASRWLVILVLVLATAAMLSGCGGGRAAADRGDAAVAEPPTTAAKTYQSKSIGLEMVLVPAGEFVMGSPASEKEQDADEKQHRVKLTKDFYMGKYEVTQGEFAAVMGFNPSWFTKNKSRAFPADTSRFPVELVTWFDCLEFCNKLSEKDGLAPYFRLTGVKRNGDAIFSADVTVLGGAGYRLPTEAEWEYACRAGTTTPFHFGSVLNGDKANVRNYPPYGTPTRGPNLERTTTVGSGSYPANAFGLCDMHGNVWEWCSDSYGVKYYKSFSGRTAIDPAGDDSEQTRRVLRGGSCVSSPRYARAAERLGKLPIFRNQDVGFRLARTP